MLDVVGLVPAAGIGARLGPLPCSKEIMPVGFADAPSHRPKAVSEYLLESFRIAGARRVFFVIRRGKWDIPEFFGDGQQLGLQIAYLMMRLPFGAAFTLDQAYPFLGQANVLLGFPDVIFRPADAFRPLLERMKRTSEDVVLGLFPTATPGKMDMVEVDRRGRVKGIEIKPEATKLSRSWIIAAWSPRFTDYLHQYVETHGPRLNLEMPETHVGEVFQSAIEDRLVVDSVQFPSGACLDTGTPEDMRHAIRLAGAGDVRAGL